MLKIETVRTLCTARGAGRVEAAGCAPGAQVPDSDCVATRHLSGCASGASD